MDKTVLRRLTGDPKKRRFAVLDIEAQSWVKPYAIGFYADKVYTDWINHDGTCLDDCMEHVLTPQYAGYWIYAHNGGNYDFQFLVNRLINSKRFKSKYLTEMTPIGSSIVQIDVLERASGIHKLKCEDPACKGCGPNKGQGEGVRLKWTLLDSAKLMPMKLSEIGEIFGVTKKVELQMSYDDLAKPENLETMRHYLKNDCVSLYEALELIQKKINGLGGQIGITLPATALDLFRRRYQSEDISTNRHWMKCPEYNQKNKEETCKGCMHEFIREAYFGGRSEIYRMLFEPYTVEGSEDNERPDDITHALMYDFNSHYPNCMLAAMPVGPAIEMEELDEQSVYSNAKQFTGIVDCDVEIPEDTYLPPLPVRHGGKLVFPTGRFSGTWDAAELALLPLCNGRIHKTRKSLWFENSSIFTRFVRALYKFRNKNLPGWTAAMDAIAKLILNSAYGKFAMKEYRSKIVLNPASPTGMKCIDLDSDIWGEEVYVSPSYIVPQLSVHVTALARVGLWKMLNSVIQKGGRIYYTDTDSIVCSGVELPTGGELGNLKVESTIKRAQFVLPKLYLVETEEENKKKKKERHIKIKAKGMGPGIRIGNEGDDELDKQLSEKEFVDLVQKGVPIERHRLTKLREGLNEFADKSLSFPRVVASNKKLQSHYDKRSVLPDYNTKPLHFEAA